jgi:glycosyltransferase involved in cell wall biosynthesis
MELADAVSVGSAFAARSLIRFGVQPAKVFVTPYGVDLEAFTPPEEPKPRKKPVFLYAGGFRREKGVHDLLAAWRTAHLGPRAGLWLAGGDRRALDEWQGPLPFGVRVLGRLSRSALAEAYRRADVFVFPTWFEGLSLAVLEAMASGLPVLTTTRSGVADRIENGRNGFLFRPGDRATLTRRLREMAASPQRISEMGAAARKTAENDSWDAYAQGCVNIARSLCVDRSHETTLSDSDHPLEPILGSARLECRLEKGR